MRTFSFSLALLSLAIPSTNARAQGRFGTAVALDGEQILVLKPAPGHGPSSVYVFREGKRGWEVGQRLYPEALERTGESFGQSLAVAGRFVVVASGDAATVWAGEAFRRDGAIWTPAGRIPLDPEASGQPLVPDQFDFQSLLKIMQPVGRSVAFDGQYLAAAVGGGEPKLKIFKRTGEEWELPVSAPVPEGAARSAFGFRVATNGSTVAVGAPRMGPSGAVYIYEPDSSGTGWNLSATIVNPDLEPGARLGSALVFDGERLLAGAPGTPRSNGGVVVEIGPLDGTWSIIQTIAAQSPQPGDLFGLALAADAGRLLVGAPGVNETRGRAIAFNRTSSGWSEVAVLDPVDIAVGAAFGTAVALNSRLAAVGAPGADGFKGAVQVYQHSEDTTYTPAALLTPGGDLRAVTGGEVACAEDAAAQFSCGNVDLLSFLPISDLGGAVGERLSDIWGWTDPETGREYAIVGRTNGAAFVDITTPANPRYLGVLPANATGTRDIKTYKNFVFVTGESRAPHGMLVFDLTHLRDVTDAPLTFEPDARYDGTANAHNLAIDTESGFAFTVGNSGGGQTCGGGLHMVDIRDPLNPSFAGCYTDTEGLIWKGRTHDAQCVIYRGPDTEYQGREICLASNETALRVVDVTDKSNPIPLAAAQYPGIGYVHQGWFTEDQRYFYLDDELDELIRRTDKTRTLVWDMSDLDDPVLVTQYYGPNSSTDHNLYIKGDLMYQANYEAGFRVIDISDREHPVEVGYFDTTPYEGNPPGFGGGAWTAFPFFESGTVIVSSINEGLFVLRPRVAKPVP